MNTRKASTLAHSKTWIVATSVGLALTSTSVLANCNNLIVEVSDPEHWEILPDTECEHGHVDHQRPNQVTLSNSTAYGPDCKVMFRKKWKKGGSEEGTLVTIRFQQNLCVLEAGKITSSHKDGPKAKQIVCKEGSYGDSKSGVCLVNF
jgi:hypothetical protein